MANDTNWFLDDLNEKTEAIFHESNLTDIGNWRSHLGIECNELEIKTNR